MKYQNRPLYRLKWNRETNLEFIREVKDCFDKINQNTDYAQVYFQTEFELVWDRGNLPGRDTYIDYRSCISPLINILTGDDYDGII